MSGTGDFATSNIQEYNWKRFEKREYPRINCHLDAILPVGSHPFPDNYIVTIKNISAGGLVFHDQSSSGLSDYLKLNSNVVLIFDFPSISEKVKAGGRVVRYGNNNQCFHAAIKIKEVENRRAFDDFVAKANENSFKGYFMANDFKTSLKEQKVLKFLQTKKLFQRIQQSVYNDVYTLQQPVDAVEGSIAIIDGRKKIIMSSYSYLGLLNDPRLVSAAVKALTTYGTGACGVRLLTGTTSLHRELEKRIAQFKNTEEAIVYSSGFLTNLAIISTIFDKHDVIFVDYLAHQSIFDGCKLSGARVIKFKHNNISDLEQKLRHSPSARKRLIATDGVFSMDGDIALIPEIVRLSKKYDALTFVDEAHALGVLGATGRGINEHFGLDPDDIDIYMGTMSKAIPSNGGYVAGNKELIYFLKHASHPFIFSAALSPAETASALKAFEIMENEPWRIENLKENVVYFTNKMKETGFNIIPSESAIVSILIGKDELTTLLAKLMNDQDIFVCPVVFPAVPRNKARIRNCIMAIHTREELDYVIAAYKKVGKKLQLI